MAARAPAKPFQGRRTKRGLSVCNSATAKVQQVHVGQDAPSARPKTTMMVVQGMQLGDSLTVVNEVQVPRPKPGTLKRALKQIIPHVEVPGQLRVPLQEAHSCRLATMAVAHTSLATLRASQGAPMPLAMVPSHRHYTMTHVHQRSLSSSPSPSPSTHPAPPSATTASAPASHPAPCSPSTYLNAPSSSGSHSSHFMSAATLHSHPATIPWSTTQQPTLRLAAQPPASLAASNASSATTSNAASRPVAVVSAVPSTSEQAVSVGCSAAEEADADERTRMVQAVVAVVASTTRAMQTAVGRNSGSDDSSSSSSSNSGGSSDGGTWEAEDSLRELLQRQRTSDLMILLKRLQQSAWATEVAEAGVCC